MERGFDYLKDKYGTDGARDIFENICTRIFQNEYDNKAKSVRVSQGDGGIDILIGDLPNTEAVYQCKYFPDELGDSQRSQIRQSYNTVCNKYKVKRWMLCLPLVLTQDELLWWSKWKNSKEENNDITIELCDGSYLINKLKNLGNYKEIFDDDIRLKLEEISDFLNESKRKIIDEIVYGSEEVKNDYNDFTFVKMLESAKIMDINDCKVEFFNAEISKQESISKDEVEGLRIYNNLKKKVHSLWKTQYRMHKHATDGNSLLTQTYLRIEDLDSSTLATTYEYNLLSKKGILHQLANEEKIGWLEDYLNKLTEYMEGE